MSAARPSMTASHVGNARPSSSSTCSTACCAISTARARRLRPQHHRHRRQDHGRSAAKNGETHRGAHRRAPRRPTRTTCGRWAACRPTLEPRATEHVAEMIAMIARLIERGHAYAADGHVLFNVPSMPDYGALSRRDRDEHDRRRPRRGGALQEGPGRLRAVEAVQRRPGPGWDSPWGRGRPGWHIECSAMSVPLPRRDLRHPRRRRST